MGGRRPEAEHLEEVVGEAKNLPSRLTKRQPGGGVSALRDSSAFRQEREGGPKAHRSIAQIELLLPALSVVNLLGGDQALKIRLVAFDREELDDEPPGPGRVLGPVLRVGAVDVAARLRRGRASGSKVQKSALQGGRRDPTTFWK
jgi:hypothetical protein